MKLFRGRRDITVAGREVQGEYIFIHGVASVLSQWLQFWLGLAGNSVILQQRGAIQGGARVLSHRV